MEETRTQVERDLEAQKKSEQDIKVVVEVGVEQRPENLKPGGTISFGGTLPTPTQSKHHNDWLHDHFHLWNSHKLPHRNSDAHAIARAEAASWAQMTPLIAATLGPLAVLLGIPSLTQKLHAQIIVDPSDGSVSQVELRYPPLNLALSIVVTVLEVLGNFFLVLRFSNYHSKLMTWLSYIFWVAKSLVGIANYIQFGIVHPEAVDIVYLQGFWVHIVWRQNLINRSAFVA